MKKLIAMLMALVMMLSMVACGGGGEEAGAQEGNAGVDLAAKYGIDMEGQGEQKLSEECATAEKLRETRAKMLKNLTSFAFDPELSTKTYDDVVAYIGCDATYYKYTPNNGWRTFTWIAADAPESKLIIIFQDAGQGYVLYASSGQYL